MHDLHVRSVLTVALVVTISCLSFHRGSAEPGAPFDGRAWFLNGLGYSSTYTVSAFGSDGRLLPHASNLTAVEHVAWPSAIDDRRSLKVYASVFDGTLWSQVGLWESPSFDPTQMHFVGNVKAALPEEPYGIGPTHVGYDPTRSGGQPYLMWYLVRGPFGPGYTIRLATSPDGLVWVSGPEVLWATQTEEAAGLSISYACRLRSGQWVLFYHAYLSLTQGYAMIALSDSNSPAGPFHEKHVIMPNDNISTQIVGTASPRTDTFAVQDSGLLQQGVSYLLSDGTTETLELVTVTKIDGNMVTVDHPLIFNHYQHHVLSVLQKKVDPSVAWQTPQGWRGVFTGYGQMAGVTSEYTVPVKATTLLGPWEVDTTRPSPVFLPWTENYVFSAENPVPVVQDLGCEIRGSSRTDNVRADELRSVSTWGSAGLVAQGPGQSRGRAALPG